MLRALRRRYMTDPLFAWARKNLPSLSDTEREALEAGDVWWEGELFSGNPDWRKLLGFPPARLSAEEEAFLAGPVEELCGMLDDWRINAEWRDLPPEVWAFLKRHKFFGMIIPRDYGGLGFSAFAHSEVVKRISTRSVAAAVTVMVPNSLGPGELLLRFGTEAQKRHYLPRLADGREIPCFALTSEEAGSDASAMVDRGVVCYGEHDGRRVLGMRLTWSKRYITLAPVATLLGLAFKLFDPERLLGGEEALGITLALVPTHTPGVEIGRRHWPAMQSFQNGPTSGKDVFVPIDAVIGGRAMVGAGWRMLMSALAAGRGISLPSLATASACLAARSTGAYARIREQFHVPIGKFEGVQERLGRIAGIAYELEAARRLTCAGLDQGHHPAVVSAIVKAHATYRMRTAVNDAMDIHGGRAIIDGPRNYLGNVYRAIPVGITVEGANDLTRNLIIFGQGAIRCHPYLLEELLALEDSDAERGRARFDRAVVGHLRHFFASLGRALVRSWSGALLAPAPAAGPMTRYYRRLGRYAAVLALAAEIAVATLGGALKRKESLSARLGDVLSELYLLSAVLKRHADEGAPAADRPLVEWCCEAGFCRIEAALDGFIRNFPVRPLAWLLRALALPWGVRRKGAADRATHASAELLMAPGATRDRLTPGVYAGHRHEGLGRVEHAFALVHAVAPLKRRVRDAGHGNDWPGAVVAGTLTPEERMRLVEADAAVAAAIPVDDFAPRELATFASVRTRRAAASEEGRTPTSDQDSPAWTVPSI
jgi:acyl-CoA dehydrogenase